MLRNSHLLTVRTGIAAVSLFGLFVSAYLIYIYVTGAPIPCAITHGCDVVRTSRYAWIWGIPMPLFGVIFYADVFALLILRAVMRERRMFFLRLHQAEIILGVLFSIFLFFVQWLDLKAFCLWCELSALASVALFVLIFLDSAQEMNAEATRTELWRYFILLFMFAPLAAFGFYLLVF